MPAPHFQPICVDRKRQLCKQEVAEKMPKDLAKLVNHYIGTLGQDHLYYEKTIILKGPAHLVVGKIGTMIQLQPLILSRFLPVFKIFEQEILVRYDVNRAQPDENEKSLQSRIHELLKYEDEHRVIFGIFSNGIKPSKIKAIFASEAKSFIKKASPRPVGRIWALEINGSGRGCGVVAADDKIKTWTEKKPPSYQNHPIIVT